MIVRASSRLMFESLHWSRRSPSARLAAANTATRFAVTDSSFFAGLLAGAAVLAAALRAGTVFVAPGFGARCVVRVWRAGFAAEAGFAATAAARLARDWRGLAAGSVVVMVT